MTAAGEHRFTARGETRLLGAHLGGQLALSGAQLDHPNGDALSVDGATIDGTVFLNSASDRRFTVNGKVRLLGTQIGGLLLFDGAELRNPEDDALDMEGARVAGAVSFRSVDTVGGVTFLDASIGRLVDDIDSWRSPSGVNVERFTYGSIPSTSTKLSPLERVDVMLSRSRPFSVQPYAHLARTYAHSGDVGGQLAR
jgi:hypothetical protein